VATSRHLAFFIAMAVGTPAAFAHESITTKLTWAREISRIVHMRCAACHREGGAAPMSLLTYEEARPWAKAIQEEVLERRMPPWGAVKGFGDFVNDMALTQEEIHLLSDWVDGGAPQGDPALLPLLPRSLDPAPLAPPGKQIAIRGSKKLEGAITLRAIAPVGLPEGATLRVVARLPDARIEPLLWVEAFKKKFQRTYVYRSPLVLPAGTRVEIIPSGAGRVRLIAAP
jgi:hypothetical protein